MLVDLNVCLLWSVIRSLSGQQSKTSSSRVWTVGWVVSSFTKLYPGVWTLEASSTHSPLATASVLTFEISVIRLTTDSRCRERPNCATLWTMRRRKYDFMRGSILVTRLSSCHWTCAESFRFISCWFDGEKNLQQRKNFNWQRKFSSWFQISRKVSSNCRIECAAKILAENAGFIANLLSNIALIPLQCASYLSKGKSGYLRCVRPSIWQFRSVRQSRRLSGELSLSLSLS